MARLKHKKADVSASAIAFIDRLENSFVWRTPLGETIINTDLIKKSQRRVEWWSNLPYDLKAILLRR